MNSGEQSKNRWSWVSENQIPVRIGALSAGLLVTLVVSTLVMALDLTRSQNRMKIINQDVQRLEVAAEADRYFGEIRYWLTDLSVSLLTLSEKRAEAARDEFELRLQQISEFAPDVAAAIQEGAVAYYDNALKAADAYTDGNRIIGNTLLAQARLGSDAVDQALSQLVQNLSDEASETQRLAAEEERRALRRAILACAVIVVAGTGLTWIVLRSILKPMQANSAAIDALISGQHDVDLPPEGPHEMGRMSQALRVLRDSQHRLKSLEKEAREQRNTILTAIETIPDGFVLFDANDQLVMVNERYRAMYAPLQDMLVPGTSFSELLKARVSHGLDDLGELSEEEWIAEQFRLHGAGQQGSREVAIGPSWVRVSQRKTPDGGTVTVFSDISDLKTKQQQLEDARLEAVAASGAKSQFLASMSHELRTPLNAIIGYSEMLAEDADDMGFGEAREDLEKIMSSGRHLLALINDVLDLSKIEAGKMELYVETFSLRSLLEEVVATVKPLVDKNGNKLGVKLELDDDEIETDKTKLRQNLFNLLSNASKFTKQGRIDLNVDQFIKDGLTWYRFSVADTGIGMTPEQTERLFDAFVQAEQSTTRDFGGTGLGLAIAQQFTKMMGGEITVQSQSGVGSTFSFEIPARTVETSVGTEETSKPVCSDQGVVLIIDDEEPARAALAEIVQREGYATLLANSATMGLELIRTHKPDAIILDVIMPGRDGWSLLKEIKSDPELCEIPVILVTIVPDRDMGLAFGAVEHLTKPISAEQLVSTLNRIARNNPRDVLIVDDDASTRTLFRRILVREGWRVHEASDGQRALTQLQTRRPTLMLLDIMMPEQDGFDVLRALRGQSDLADLPVIVITSKDLSRQELDWLKAHASDVIRKGADGRAELIAALQRHLKDLNQTEKVADHG